MGGISVSAVTDELFLGAPEHGLFASFSKHAECLSTWFRKTVKSAGTMLVFLFIHPVIIKGRCSVWFGEGEVSRRHPESCMLLCRFERHTTSERMPTDARFPLSWTLRVFDRKSSDGEDKPYVKNNSNRRSGNEI